MVGKGYDQNALAEQRHPTRAVLDAVSADHPIMIVHQSAHMGVFNTRALELLGVTADTPAPAGGAIGKEGGALTGYMEENAFLYYQAKTPMPDMDDLMDAYRRVQQMYASYGVTTVQAVSYTHLHRLWQKPVLQASGLAVRPRDHGRQLHLLRKARAG